MSIPSQFLLSHKSPLHRAPKFGRPIKSPIHTNQNTHYQKKQFYMKTQQQIMDEEYRKSNKKTATAILKRTLHVDEQPTRKKSPSPPTTPPKLERANAWYTEPKTKPMAFTTLPNLSSPTDLASRLALGVSESFNTYPVVSTYYFVLNNKNTIHRELAVYHVGVHLFETGKRWSFYITMPKASVRILETSIESD